MSRWHAIHSTFAAGKSKKMIRLFLIPIIVVLSCGSAKKNQSAAPAGNATEKTVAEAAGKDSIPSCIREKINKFKGMQQHEQPQRVIEYSYQGKKVYYVAMPCCDFFNEVYDDKCNLLGAPDGGFTGKGDGKLPDFAKEAKNEKLIWEAKKN